MPRSASAFRKSSPSSLPVPQPSGILRLAIISTITNRERTMTARAIAAALSAVAAFGLCASARAQNSYSFLDGAKSPVNYSLANATPQMKCTDLVRFSTTDVTIISAQLIPATNGVPEHCRVTGNILPEIAFEVNLPSSWNRRFYMNGNGGYAGERPDVPTRVALRANALRNG